MSRENDIVEDIFSRVRELLGDDFKGDIVIKLDLAETRIRQDWGGTEPYIARKRDIQKKKSAALESLKRGLSVREASKECDVSVTSIYRMLRSR